MDNLKYFLVDYWWSLIFIFILIGFLSFKNKHRFRVKKGNQILKRIRGFKGENLEKRIISYLQKIDPFTFEEMLLTLFEESGAKIYRNKRYTGDGGIDGKFKYKGKYYLIQAKRYKKYINPKDVQKFSELCRIKKVKGLFIHTGIAGKLSNDIATNSDNIIIIHPNELVKFIKGEPIIIF